MEEGNACGTGFGGPVPCSNLDSNSNNNNGISINGSLPSSLEDDPLTALTLAPPGIGGDMVAEPRMESFPAGFWDVMRDVIAREVRDYVSSTISENSGFR